MFDKERIQRIFRIEEDENGQRAETALNTKKQEWLDKLLEQADEPNKKKIEYFLTYLYDPFKMAIVVPE